MNKYKTVFRVGKSFAFYIGILSINLILSSCSGKLTDRELFELYVLKPMPDSVKDLRIDYYKGTREAKGTCFFRMSPNDFEKLITSKGFKLNEFNNFDIPIPEELSKHDNLEIYGYSDGKSCKMYKFVTNKTHDLYYYFYLRY